MQYTSGRGCDVDIGIDSRAGVEVETAEHSAAIAKSYSIELPMQRSSARVANHQKEQQTGVQEFLHRFSNLLKIPWPAIIYLDPCVAESDTHIKVKEPTGEEKTVVDGCVDRRGTPTGN